MQIQQEDTKEMYIHVNQYVYVCCVVCMIMLCLKIQHCI